MKYLIPSFFFLFFSALSIAQPSQAERFLDAGVKSYSEGKLDSAIFYWKRVILSGKEQDNEYGRALLNLGVVSEDMGDHENAKKWYKTILIADLNEKAPPFEEGDQFASYKFHACMRLSSMYAHDNNYRQALHYTNLTQTTYPYITEDGNEFEYQYINVVNWQSAFYLKLNLPDSALYVLTQKIFDWNPSRRVPGIHNYEYVNYYDGITKAAMDITNTRFSNKKLAKDGLDKALEAVEMSKEGGYYLGKFKWLGLSYTVAMMRRNSQAADVVAQIKATAYYKWLSE